jgi:hypothetical protein
LDWKNDGWGRSIGSDGRNNDQTRSGFFAPTWNRATDRQQIFMQVIATLENGNEEFSVQDITNESRQLLKKPFNPSHATQMLGHLAEKGLIYRNRRGSYCFAVPLLANYIQRQSWDAATRR